MNEYNTMKYEQNYTAVCPYCDHENNTEDIYGDTNYLRECESCNRVFNVEKIIIYKYTTLGINCITHKIRLLNKNVNQFYCIICKRKYYDWELPDGQHPKLKIEQFTMEN